jgi:large subunit ribosomal protein L24e
MKRNPRKLKWTKAYRKNAGKEMVVDSTLLFAARRNVPQRYNRELVAKTLQAMKRVSEIRSRRERAFYKRRMAGKRAREIAAARKLVAENEHLLPRLRGSEKKLLAEKAEKLGIPYEELEREALAKAGEKKWGEVFGGEKQRVKQKIADDEADSYSAVASKKKKAAKVKIVEKVRQRMRADGTLEESIVRTERMEDDDDDDDSEEDDDEMDMD